MKELLGKSFEGLAEKQKNISENISEYINEYIKEYIKKDVWENIRY